MLKPTTTLTMEDGDLLMVNGLPLTRKMINMIESIVTQDRPISLIRVISNKVTAGLLRDNSVDDEPFAIIQDHLIDLIEDFDSVKQQ